MPNNSHTPVLAAEGLHKTFGDVKALDNVSISLNAGEICGFVGANGAGKTTTMRIMMGVLADNGGTVSYRGKPATPHDRQRFGYMPEERGLYPKMKIADQVTYFGELAGLSRAEAKASTAKLLEQLSLTERAKDDVQDLSLGNQQRVQLAVSLVADPDILILDEPFSGLDPLAVDVMVEALQARAATGVPVLFSSHQLELVERICHSVVIIGAGKIIAAGTVEELKASVAAPLRLRVTTDADLSASLPGLVSRDGADYLIMDADSEAVLDIARAAGSVEHFAYDQPSIADIFREAIAK